MYRVVKLTGVWYGAELDCSDIYGLTSDDKDAIDSFINQGEPVVIGEFKDDLEELLGEITWL